MINYIIIETNGDETIDWFYENEFINKCINSKKSTFKKEKIKRHRSRKDKSTPFYIRIDTIYEKVACPCGGRYMMMNKKRHFLTCRKHLNYEQNN
jgi:hypothetical protein